MAAGQSMGAAAASLSPTASAAPADPSARWLADAATTMGSEFYRSLPDSLWTSRALIAFHSLALPLALWFKPVCVFFALFWLIYRAAQVLKKPLDELASLLGFDIPLTPTIDLASVKADGALIHWNLPEKQKQKSSLKFEIHLNGSMIDAVSIHESAVTITGLQPATFYVVRVALVTSHDFSSKSIPIRFRTKSASSGDYFIVAVDGPEPDHDSAHESVPRVRPYRGLKDISPAHPPSSTAAARDIAPGLTPRRLTNGRRVPPSTVETSRNESVSEEGDAREGAEVIQQLTEKLDAIRRETDEAEKQAREEEDEERKQKDELTRERDELKAGATEKDRASRNLKREVNVLERQNTAAQNERAKQERLLVQKKQDRQKLKDDMVRWEREMAQMRADVERILEQKTEHLATIAQQKEELQQQQADKTANLQTLDSEVKEKTAEVKKLERSLKNSSPSGAETEPSLVQQYQQDAEEERAWQVHRQSLHHQYTLAYQKMESSKRFHQEQMRYLDSLRAERRRVEEVAQYASPPPTQERLPRRADSQRSRPPHRHSTSDSPRLATFPPNQSPFSGSMTNVPSGSGFPSAPYLNIQNGMTIAGPTGEIPMSDEERERLTGGALMSPGAGAELIPADLFDSDNKAERVNPLPGLGALPGLAGLPGPTPLASQQQQDNNGQGPASPVSASSRSPSVFASPHASLQNLQMGSPDHAFDSDRRSIRSNRSNRAASGTGSRFSSIFKPRAKTGPEEGPALSKASSMPHPDQAVAGLDSAGRKRNSSISGTTSGAPPFSGDGADDAPADPATAAPAKRHFNFFGSRDKSGGWPSSFRPFAGRPSSPRPGSTHSTELPRPSADGSRWGADAWPSADAGNGGNRSSPLAFGPGWNAPGQQSRMFGSRHPSRRPSVQYGASAPPEDILEAEDDDGFDMLEAGQEAAQLAPIGTRPAAAAATTASTSSNSKQQEADNAAALNPNAKDFKSKSSFFSSMKLTKSKESNSSGQPSSTSDKALTPSISTANSASLQPNLEPTTSDDSPPASRKSRDTRDTRSLNTTESSVTGTTGGAGAGGAESSANSVDLVRTPSYTPSDATAPSATLPAPSPSLATTTSKESFMAKLTRKSSSGKFSLPTFRSSQREKSRLDGSSGTGGIGGSPIVGPHTPGSAGFPPATEEDEDGGGDENGLSASVGSFVNGRIAGDPPTPSAAAAASAAGGKDGKDGKEGKEGKDRGGASSGRSWGNVLKLSKSSASKKSIDSPSLSGLSMTSGTTEEGEEGLGQSQSLED